jgi:hypothetical protein
MLVARCVRAQVGADQWDLQVWVDLVLQVVGR